jgi:hypothetical protein
MQRFPPNTVVRRLNHAGLVALLGSMADGSLPETEIDRRLLTFCLNCPDPAGAMDVFLDAERGTTDTVIVDRALSLPARVVASVPVSELSADHPLRHWKVEG